MWGNSGQPLIQSRPLIRSKLDVVGNIFCRFCMGKYHLIKSIGMQSAQLTQYVRKYLMRIVKWKWTTQKMIVMIFNAVVNPCCCRFPIIPNRYEHGTTRIICISLNDCKLQQRKFLFVFSRNWPRKMVGQFVQGVLNTYHYIKHIHKLHRAHLFWCNIMKIVSKSFNNKKKTCSIYKLTIYSYS